MHARTHTTDTQVSLSLSLSLSLSYTNTHTHTMADWDRRTRAHGGVAVDMRNGYDERYDERMVDAAWAGKGGGRGGGGGNGRRLPHEPLHHRVGGGGGGRNQHSPPQWGPQARASRNVSARIEERRAQLRERERERDHVPRAVSSPQVRLCCASWGVGGKGAKDERKVRQVR